jgi:hypothetical protein
VAWRLRRYPQAAAPRRRRIAATQRAGRVSHYPPVAAPALVLAAPRVGERNQWKAGGGPAAIELAEPPNLPGSAPGSSRTTMSSARRRAARDMAKDEASRPISSWPTRGFASTDSVLPRGPPGRGLQVRLEGNAAILRGDTRALPPASKTARPGDFLSPTRESRYWRSAVKSARHPADSCGASTRPDPVF